jgi:predicted dehydrogenase
VQSTFSERTTPVHTLEVFGQRGCLRLSLSRFDGLEVIPVDSVDSAVGTRARAVAATVRGLPRALPELRRGGVFASSYVAQWEDFARAVRSGEPVAPDLEDGRRALAVSLAAAQSASEGRPVPVAEAPAALASSAA